MFLVELKFTLDFGTFAGGKDFTDFLSSSDDISYISTEWFTLDS